MKLLQKSGSKNGLSSIDITREEVRATNKEPRKGLLTKNIRDEDETPKSEAAAVAAAEAPTPSLLVCFFLSCTIKKILLRISITEIENRLNFFTAF